MSVGAAVRGALYRRRSGGEPASDRSLRAELLRPARGRVLEVGCGDGRSLDAYAGIGALVAVEEGLAMASAARRTARAIGCPAHVVIARAEALPFAAATFDTAVSIHTLCAVSDPRLVLDELDRTLRPGGELRFLEHVVARWIPAALLQRALDAVWPAFDGCHCNRDTVGVLGRARWSLVSARHFLHAPRLINVPIAPHVLGVATAPGMAAR